MKRSRSVIYVLLCCLPLLNACKPQASKVVEAVTSSILEQVSIEVTPDAEIGEIVLSDEGKEITFKATNKSSNEIRDISFSINTDDNVIDFKPTADGEVAYPGLGGTCKTILKPNESCIVKLIMFPRKQGEFNILASFKYTNMIEPQKKDINFHLIAGDPASLTFTNDVSNYSLGVFEQTEAIERFHKLEIQNSGGLPARNIDITMNNDDLDPAYKITDNNCPKKLGVGKKCQLIVSYTPQNNNYSDPEQMFTGHVAFDYIRDPEENAGHLKGYLTFTSATIEAKFKTNFPVIDFGTVTAGNKEIRSIKLSNQGYREGILKKLIIKFPKPDADTAALPITECIKGSGTILNCQKNLFDFPFILEDLNSCLENEVQGSSTAGANPNCFFKVTYWPSANYASTSQSIHNFNLATISFNYDSHWKGLNNIVTKDGVFELQNHFLAKALLEVYSIKIDNVAVLPAKMLFPNKWLNIVDLERLAKLADTSSFNKFEIRFKNSGEVPALFSSITDGANPSNYLVRATDTAPDFLEPTTSRHINSYYKSLKLSDECISPIAPQGTNCSLTFELYPVKQANASIEDALMYDDVSNLFSKFKIFKLTYKDGGQFEDDGSLVTSRTLETRLISQLIAKGKLVIMTPTPLNLGTIVHGETRESRIVIKNGGTGDIKAIQFQDIANSFEAPKVSPFPYSFLDYAPGTLPVDTEKDCNKIIYASSALFPFPADSSKVLQEGESCSLRLTSKAPRSLIAGYFSSTSTLKRDDYTRFFDHNLNSLEDIWNKQANGSSNDGPLKLRYWDGDDNSLNDSNSYSLFGYKAFSTLFTVKSTFIDAANLGFSLITGFPNAVIYRPATTYPAINQTVPDINNIPAVNFPLRLFTTSNFNLSPKIIGPSSPCSIGSNSPLFNEDVTGSSQSTAVRDFSLCQFYMGLGVPYTNSNYHMIHLGTFPVGEIAQGTISIGKFSTETATNIFLQTDSSAAGLPIQIKKFGAFTIPDPYVTPQFSATQNFAIDVKVQGALPGRVERCYDITYKSALGDRDLRFCFVADIVATAPKLEIKYFNNDVTWNTSTNVFDYIPDATPTLVTSPMSIGEVNPSTPDKLISMMAVVGQPNVVSFPNEWNNDKKIIQLKNIGTAPLVDYSSLSNFKIELVRRTDNLPDIAKTTFIPPSAAEIASCLPLAVNATCNLTIYFVPKTISSADTTDYLLFSYPIADKQFVNQYVALRFEGLVSAKAAVTKYQITTSRVWGAAGTTGQLVAAVNSWVNPALPNTSPVQNTYSLKLGTGNATAQKLTALPTSTTFVLDINNTTPTKISFLKANPAPIAGTWNVVYPPAGLPATHNGNKVQIQANRGCFYGDDELIPMDPSLKGFNSTSVNKCQLKVIFQGDITYSNCVLATKAKVATLGGIIINNCNPYVFDIPYWNYKRSTFANFYTHIEDFIQPSKSSYTTNVPNLKVTYVNATTSQVKVTIPATLSPLNAASWGNIIKYRILFALDKTKFNSNELYRYDYTTATDSPMTTFKSGMIIQETANATGGVELTQNLTNGKYYFVKIMAIRQSPALPGYPTGFFFLSDPLVPVTIVATPVNNTMAYVDALKGFVDKTTLNNTIYSQTAALAACNAATFNVTNVGTNILQRKQLITTNEFQYIRANFVETLNSDLVTPYDPANKSLWLADAPVLINSSNVKTYNGATVVGGFPGFNNANLSGNDNTLKLAYNKECSNVPATCNNLVRLVGGDGVDSYIGGAFYTNTTKIIGYARCFTPITCPINTAIKLSNGACVIP
jgi:hypothetical protein